MIHPDSQSSSTLDAAQRQGITAPPRHDSSTPLRVYTLVFDGVDDLDFVAPNEVFLHAKHQHAAVERSLVTSGNMESGEPSTIETVAGIPITATRGWSPADADVILVPGGPGVTDEIKRGHIPSLLAAARRPGLVLASVCAGARLLAAAGITRGRPCITHHRWVKEVQEQGGEIIQARVVDDGDLVTSGGITSGLDLALWLVERYFGPQSALGVERIMEYERRGTVWRRP